MASESVGRRDWRGLQLAGLIGLAWWLTLSAGLRLPLQQLHPLVLAAFVLLRSFLHTGLFIVAHDAMHGTLAPAGLNRLNRCIGQSCLWIYAGLDFEQCLNHHVQHHQAPGSARDPDVCTGTDPSALAWYVRFLSHYLNPMQLLRLTCCLGLALLFMPDDQQQPLLTLALIVVLPLIISSWQLFVVGTFLPHRNNPVARNGVHQPISLNLHPILSFAACYHFGYHREHHSCPTVPWHQLPAIRTAVTKS